MKLKLETQDNVTILLVSEDIEPTHLPVLKAGLTKLFQSGKKTVVLDFTPVTEKNFKSPMLFEQISELRLWAPQLGGQVVTVSTLPALGHVATRAEAVQLLNSPLAQLTALEAGLRARLKELEKKKAELTQLLSKSPASELKKMQNENSSLKKNLVQTEKTARVFLKQRTREPVKSPEAELRQKNLEALTDSFLQKEGLLK